MKAVSQALLASLLFSNLALSAEPTPSRLWKATSGHTTEGIATHADKVSVTLQLTTGKNVNLPLDKLAPEDREFLAKHFGFELPKEGDPISSNDKPLDASAVPHPIGKVTGPLKASDISNYYIYIPTSLKAGRKAPLLHYNDSSPVSPVKMNRLVSACEYFGWVLVGSADSKNGNNQNRQIALDNVTEVKKLGIIDPARIYFTGNSGGGATSWMNCQAQEAAGTIPMNAYLPGFDEYQYKKGHHYVVGGASDFNRYASAYAASRFEGTAVYRPYPGAHTPPKPEAVWIYEDAISWLTMRYLMTKERDKSFQNERLDFESSMIRMIQDHTQKGNPHLAYHLCQKLIEDYKISGPNAAIVTKLHSSLKSDQEHVLFHKALTDIHDFAIKNFIEEKGTYQGPSFPEHNKKIDTLLETYKGIPFIDETLNGLKAATK